MPAMSGLKVSASAPGILPPPDPGEEQQAAGLGILLQISMLILSFLVGHLLRRRKFYYLPEASVSLLIESTPACISVVRLVAAVGLQRMTLLAHAEHAEQHSVRVGWQQKPFGSVMTHSSVAKTKFEMRF
ncbi:hypothetical protein ZIOFF_033256 [Zingiber officinale]|uniref:Uncharacterized protein n=1 Tax=Zingiber officinale TaxID=94328 RepID=A0A8J5GQ03_ZINOF|nr:hypothetical protein ZIOFF_033256 [Zingiber officinale]